jgi:two-component system, cell cycle response regulator
MPQPIVPPIPQRGDVTMNISPPTRPTPPAPVAPAPVDWVLVVDDNQTVREFMKSKLAPFGFNVDYAETGEQAVGFTGQKHYTCVFLDVIMPGIDGYQVCKLIKSKKSIIGKTAVVMLTSKGSPFDKIRGAMAGCDAYLTKPVNEEKLLETIVKFIPTHA